MRLGWRLNSNTRIWRFLERFEIVLLMTGRGFLSKGNDIAAIIGQLSGYTFTSEAALCSGKALLLSSLSNCCVELYLFKERINARKASKAPDVSHRLTTTPPAEFGRVRYVD